jgi:leucyl/phenylalanyl-tRNA--protein transferase
VTGPFWINEDDPSSVFPPVELALEEPNGLLAVGGDLSPARLIHAYRHGIFPWFNDDQPILWWSPDPRAILLPEQLHISRSMRKLLRKSPFAITLDQDFEGVLRACAAPRRDEAGTWITPDMHQAYLKLHHMGVAHSVEAWQGERLVGGLYGVAIGAVFFGESMFSRVSNASKLAFIHLVRQLQHWGYGCIDCQVSSEHLHSLGAINIRRIEFIRLLRDFIDRKVGSNAWQQSDLVSPANRSTASA